MCRYICIYIYIEREMYAHIIYIISSRWTGSRRSSPGRTSAPRRSGGNRLSNASSASELDKYISYLSLSLLYIYIYICIHTHTNVYIFIDVIIYSCTNTGGNRLSNATCLTPLVECIACCACCTIFQGRTACLTLPA